MRAALCVLAALLACTTAANEKKIVCYFGSWAVYRPGNGLINISDIDPKLCTHLIYTFVGLSNETYGVGILDPWADLPAGVDGGGKNGFYLFNELRGLSPHTKTLIAIGGWNEGSEKYSKMTGDAALRDKFVESAVSFVRKYGFDGLDFDWEYPNQRGGVPADRENFLLLLKQLRKRFDEESLLLTAALGAAEKSASLSYDIKEVSKYLDFMNLMAYDFHGAWDEKTGINAPLYAGYWESGADKLLNVNASIHYWLEQGAPREKMVLGMPFYGRSFTLDNPKIRGIGAPAKQPGKAGPYTREVGTIGYNEICEMHQTEHWEQFFDLHQQVPYTIKGNQWIGYENPRSIKAKAQFIKDLDLAGAMLWSIETDDFKGICGRKYPMLKTLNEVLRGFEFPEDPSEPEEPTNEVKCEKSGYIRDPLDCSVFYVCIPDAKEGFHKHKLSCPNGLYFDTVKNSCDWPENVDCDAK